MSGPRRPGSPRAGSRSETTPAAPDRSPGEPEALPSAAPQSESTVLSEAVEKPDSSPRPDRESARSVWRDGRGWPYAAGLLALLAFAPLYLSSGAGEAALPLPDARDAERFFFEPHQSSPALVLLIAAWLGWRRKDRLLASPPRSAPVAAGASFAAALAFGVWARLNEAPDLLVFSLIASTAGFALASRGWAGARVLGAPLIALLFALPIPGRLQNEIIWSLQLWSATSAHGLLELFGIEVARNGLFMSQGDSGFLVIESCSGFRSLHILLLVALVLRDLVELRRLSFVLFLATPIVALGLNAVRIAWIVWTDPGNASTEGHVGQGLTILLVGSGLLFALAVGLSRADRTAPERDAPHTPPSDPAASSSRPAPSSSVWASLTGVLALLCIIQLTISPWSAPGRTRIPIEASFADRGGWTGEDVASDRIFIGSVSVGRMRHRRMTHPGSRAAPRAGLREMSPGVVEVFVALESSQYPRWSPFSDLLLLPARDWGLRQTQSRQDWRLQRPLDEAIAVRGSQTALVRLWRIRDPGVLVESLRSLLALERGPFERPHDRAVIRLVTPLELNAAPALRDAQQRLDQFVIDFGEDFDRIEG